MTSAPDAMVESGQGARQARRAGGLRRRRVRDSGRASTTVSIMKVLLPACVIGMLLMVLAWPQILKVEENYTIATRFQRCGSYTTFYNGLRGAH